MKTIISSMSFHGGCIYVINMMLQYFCASATIRMLLVASYFDAVLASVIIISCQHVVV